MLRGRRVDDFGPTYLVEHLAAFGVGAQFGLQWPVDGIRKLKQMERSSAIWAQKMILRLTPNAIVLEDENREIVEQFPLHLVSEPSAHLSTDSRDVYNNLLIFVVNEDKQYNNRAPTEMHIFHCVRVSAKDVAEDIGQFLRGRFGSVKRGKPEGVHFPLKETSNFPLKDSGHFPSKDNGHFPLKDNGHFPPKDSGHFPLKPEPGFYNGHTSSSSNGHLTHGAALNTRLAEYDAEPLNMGFERDVNTLNRCFDDVERFVTRIQQAALAQRDIEAMQQRKREKFSKLRAPVSEIGLHSRVQLPTESEFVEVFKKFKLCFNILAKLRSHIHEPNAPELLHFLFTPFMVILDACQWGLGRNIATQVVSPLITREATNLLQHSLTSKEYEVWISLGEAWKTPAEDWNGTSPVTFTPTFTNGFASPTTDHHKLPRQYNTTFDQMGHSTFLPDHSRDHSQGHSSSAILTDRSRDQTDDYKTGARHLADKEKFLQEKELKLTKLQKHLREEQQKVRDMMERVSLTTPERDRQSTAKVPPHRSNSQYREQQFQESSATHSPSADAAVGTSESSRQKMFLDALKMKRAKVAQVTYDRVGQNSKELTVSKDEYLEIMNDTKNWWEVRNSNNRIGFVPNTILHLVYDEGVSKFGVEQPISVKVPYASPSSGPPSAGFYNAQDHKGLNGGGMNGDGRRHWSSYSDQVTTEKRTKRVLPY